MENTEKVQNYKGGEIRRTPEGYYVFVKDGAHSGPYVSISAARGTVEATDADVDNADEEPAVESSEPVATEETTETADEQPEAGNTNDDAEAGAVEATDADVDNADEE